MKLFKHPSPATVIALLAAGGLLVGASACGSGSSSDSSRSTSTVQKRQAGGYLGTKLTVTNEFADGVDVRICSGDTNCKPYQTLKLG